MRVFGIIFILIAMLWTWNIIHGQALNSTDIHEKIQNALIDNLIEVVKAKHPDASEIKFQRIWTENISENQIRAVFTYSFLLPATQGPAVEQKIEGELFLERVNQTEQEDRWKKVGFKANNQTLNFTEELVIRAGEEPQNEVPAPTDTNSESKTKPVEKQPDQKPAEEDVQ